VGKGALEEFRNDQADAVNTGKRIMSKEDCCGAAGAPG
jgi:hypothetical protein